MVTFKKTKCTECYKMIDALDTFPQGRCVDCHEKHYNHAQEIKKAQKDANHLRNLFINTIK